MKVAYVIFASLCLLCMPTAAKANVTGSDLKTKMAGQWKVSIPIPGMEHSFMIDIRERDNALVFDIQSGELDIQEMRLNEKNGKLSANLYLGEQMKLVIWEEKGVIQGALVTSMLGEIPLIFSKVEKTTK